MKFIPISVEKQQDKKFTDFFAVFCFLEPGVRLKQDDQHPDIQDVFHQYGQAVGMIHSAEKNSRSGRQEIQQRYEYRTRPIAIGMMRGFLTLFSGSDR